MIFRLLQTNIKKKSYQGRGDVVENQEGAWDGERKGRDTSYWQLLVKHSTLGKHCVLCTRSLEQQSKAWSN